jgi:hypothetical protein
MQFSWQKRIGDFTFRERKILVNFLSMNSNKIVADIVLIPPEEMLQLTINLNKSSPDTAQEDYVLDGKNCIPHITLLMGVISRAQLDEITYKLRDIAQRSSALELTATSFTSFPQPDGKMFSTLKIEKSPELQNLHDIVLKELTPFFSWDNVRSEMFYRPPPVKEISSFWVESFEKNGVRENYDPHISLGFAKLNEQFTPKQFTASKFALCHLGNYCTCRDVLWSCELR